MFRTDVQCFEKSASIADNQKKPKSAPGSVLEDPALMGITTGNAPVESSPVNNWSVSAYAVQIQEEPEGYSACYRNK